MFQIGTKRSYLYVSSHLIKPILNGLSNIPQEWFMWSSCMSVCMSVRPSVFMITQERLDVECWNLAQLYLRSRVGWRWKLGHVHDLWPGQINNFHNAHSECMQDCIVYMCTYPFLWNTCKYVLQQSIYLLKMEYRKLAHSIPPTSDTRTVI